MRALAVLLATASLVLASCSPAAPASNPAEQGAAEPAAASVVPAEAFTPADQAELAAATRTIQEGGAVFVGIPNPPLGLCVGQDETLCRYEQLKAVRGWRAAYQGDYAAQRNVAFCLSTGCDGLQSDRVQGCAWRMVIIEAADPKVGGTDVSNMEVECRQLSEAGRSAAALQAARIATTIAQAR